MLNGNKKKLKKYLFLISILFFVLFGSHLIYDFLYSDSKTEPIKGGIVSEGLIGNFPSLNPLKTLNGNNEYIVGLLYRSLSKYDSSKEEIISDLANCDISNLLNIECYLNDNIFWSNGDPITATDVVKTYNIIKTSDTNRVLSSILDGVEISNKNNTIIFKSEKKDLNILNILFQPILKKEIIDSLGIDSITGDFPTTGQIYSGPFIISRIESDLTMGITKIFLTKNKFYTKGNISTLVIKLFSNVNSLLKNKGLINIYNDTNNIIGDSIPRLESHKYTLPQYISLFINSENIKNSELRNFILNKINRKNLINILGTDSFKEVINPYLTEINIDKNITNKNFDNIMSSMGYIKKSKIIEDFLPNKTKKYSPEAIIKEKKIDINEEKNTKIKNIENEEKTIDKFQKDSKYIIKPEYVDKYNFITKENILLEGIAGKNIKEIYINDYKLSNYKSGDSKFYIRLKKGVNLKLGENNFKLYFVEDSKKELKEEINFLYYPNKDELKKQTNIFIEELYKKNEKKDTKIVEKIEINKDELKKISSLDDKFYYNKDLNKFSLNLYYISSDKNLEKVAIFVKNSLLEIGINIEIFPVTLNDLAKLISEKKKYDIIITGINLGYFKYNIFPYFHSSQSKSSYNFSNIKKTSLDILLEELKTSKPNSKNKEKIQNKILDILKEEQVIKTLYTPKLNLLIDKNIKNTKIDDIMTSKSDRKKLYDLIYINENKIINFENKSIIDFFSFLLKKLND